MGPTRIHARSRRRRGLARRNVSTASETHIWRDRTEMTEKRLRRHQSAVSGTVRCPERESLDCRSLLSDPLNRPSCSLCCLHGGETMRDARPCGPCRGSCRFHPRRARPLRRLAGPFHQEVMWPCHCARITQFHAGSRRSERVYTVEERPGKAGFTMLLHASSAGPLQLKEVMLFAWRGPRGSTQLFASPSGSDVAQLCGAGPCGS